MAQREDCKKDIDNAKGFVAFVILPSEDKHPDKHQTAIYLDGPLRDMCAALEMGMKTIAKEKPDIFKALKSYIATL